MDENINYTKFLEMKITKWKPDLCKCLSIYENDVMRDFS